MSDRTRVVPGLGGSGASSRGGCSIISCGRDVLLECWDVFPRMYSSSAFDSIYWYRGMTNGPRQNRFDLRCPSTGLLTRRPARLLERTPDYVRAPPAQDARHYMHTAQSEHFLSVRTAHASRQDSRRQQCGWPQLGKSATLLLDHDIDAVCARRGAEGRRVSRKTVAFGAVEKR